MDKENKILIQSKAFAIRIIRAYQYLCDEKHEYVMSKQLLRSGTSIGANVRESSMLKASSTSLTNSTLH